jgi:uncharacterized spore protein YtfJ
VRTIEGDPFSVAGKKFTPVARVYSFGKASGTIGKGLSGWCTTWARIKPIAMLVETEEGVERVAITDGTGLALRGIFSAAVGLTLLLTIVRIIARRQRAAAQRAES